MMEFPQISVFALFVLLAISRSFDARALGSDPGLMDSDREATVGELVSDSDDEYQDEDDDYDEYQDEDDDYDNNGLDLDAEAPYLSLRNLETGIPKPVGVGEGTQQHIPRETPDYMLKLYKKFSQNQYMHPTSDIVRSFMNINDDPTLNISFGKEELPGSKTRNHTLVFNITTFSKKEVINLAQLRLYTLVERDRKAYIGVDRKVSVYEIITEELTETRLYKIISSKHIYGRNSGWETFDVTPAVRRWVSNVGNMQILEVCIETIFASAWGGDMDINTAPRKKNEPLLIVFSSYRNKKQLHQEEREELLSNEMSMLNMDIEENDTVAVDGQELRRKAKQPDPEGDLYGKSSEGLSHLPVANGGRVRQKRSKKSRRNICRRTKWKVNFRETKVHDWIIAPDEYMAYECSGKCYYPFSTHVKATKYAILRGLLHLNKKASRPCCVPTKLDSISILYYEKKTGVFTYKYQYDGMKVAECGCR